MAMDSNTTSIHYQPPEHRGLNILYIDDALIVLNKPAGLLSVPGRGNEKQDCLTARVQQEYPEVLSVHRLDMETSGIIIMARNANVHRQLGQLFEQRKIHKRYVAIVDGRVKTPTGSIDLPLCSDWPNRPRQKVDADHGKPAMTRYRLLQYISEENCSLLELTPLSGRTHQLRVHLMSLGHPIHGDRLYATRDIVEKSSRLLLHASYLAFKHPLSREPIEIESEPPFLTACASAGSSLS
jgi:tRNA pseudouridine32 synthase/23S rRNA pseudouridine746 synthase